ncbi:MAG: ABC transporter substrate-binding protein [Bacillota bacterium]|jgi:multiple sugar transport system substrate-binding protein
MSLFKRIVCVAVICLCLQPIASEAAAKPRLQVWLKMEYMATANDVLKRQCDEFGRKHNVDVQVSFIPGAEMVKKFAAAIEAGTLPDVAELDTSEPVRFRDMGLLLDVTDVAQEIAGNQGGYIPMLLPLVKEGERFYGVPFNNSAVVMFVRTDLLNAAGLEIPKTYDDLLEVGKKISNPKKGIYGVGSTYNRSDDGENVVRTILWAFGSRMTAEDGRTVTFNSPETLAAVKYMAELSKATMPPGIMGWTDPSNNEAWIAGEIGITFGPPSIYWQVQNPPHPLGPHTVMAAPPVGPAGGAIMCQPWTFAVFKKTKNPDLAKDLVRHLMEKENLWEYIEASGGFSGPSTFEGYQHPLWKSSPSLQAYAEALQSPDCKLYGWPGPVTAGACEVRARRLVCDMMSNVLVNGRTPEQAVAQCEKELKDLYSRYE